LPGEVLSIDWHSSGIHKDAIVRYFPVGVVAAITPFNFPLNLVAHKIAPAIAAGCPIVVKPASKTPITALALARIIDNAGLPKGALSVVPMDRDSGHRLVTDPRFGLLSFTGSAENGWKIKQQAGKKKVLLELGGNAALIVDKDADIELAAAKAVGSGFTYAGQSCIHTQRIYVEQSVFEPFVSHFLAAMVKLTVGDPEQADTDFSAMISEQHAMRIESWVREAVAGGATLLTGGTGQGTLYAPTVLTGTNQSMKVCAQEAFAPVVVIERFADFKAAVDAVNISAFGLQAGVFTFDSRKIHYAFQNLHVGGVMVNEVPSFRADHMPYGGIKDSGLGREGPKYAIKEMLEPKILVSDHSSDL
jgi:acyl-CoA reductase-like NAD-dependent aldehyde dehydrogenase